MGDGVMSDNRIEQINDLRSLNYNWDGYGALPITEGSIALALEILTSIPESFGVVPTVDGGVMFDNGIGSIIEVWVGDE